MSFSLGLGVGLTRRGGGLFDITLGGRLVRDHNAANIATAGGTQTLPNDSGSGLPAFTQSDSARHMTVGASYGVPWFQSVDLGDGADADWLVTASNFDVRQTDIIGLVMPTGSEAYVMGDVVNRRFGFLNGKLRTVKIFENADAAAAADQSGDRTGTETHAYNKWYVIHARLLASGNSFIRSFGNGLDGTRAWAELDRLTFDGGVRASATNMPYFMGSVFNDATGVVRGTALRANRALVYTHAAGVPSLAAIDGVIDTLRQTADTLRGVGAVSFDYAAYGTPTFWMDAGRFDGSNETSGSTLTENWGNRMGAGYPYFKQTTSGNQPTLAQVNGKWVADFGAAVNVTNNISDFDYMKFVNAAGSAITADLVDTHTMSLIYIGAEVGNRFLFGLDDAGVNLQIGTNSSSITITGTPRPWDRDLDASPATISGNSWYLFEAILRGGGRQSFLLIDGTVVASSNFRPNQSGPTGYAYPGALAATPVLIDMIGGGLVSASAKYSLGGKIARTVTWDISSGLVADVAAPRADMLALKAALEA